MQRVIGLDIGSYSIKAVEILNTFKSYEIINFYEKVIPIQEDTPRDALAALCMEQLFKENKLEADRIVTAMPGQFISSRLMTFGFSEPRKVETAVFAEVEDVVPFNMEDMIVDHQILGTVDDKTVALAVMTRKVFLKNFLDLLQRINIDPKLVDVDSLAFYNLSSYMKVEPGESFAMVDIGHEKTSVCIVRDGVLRLFRSINLGGRYITEFLARDLEVSFIEAQKIKHEISRVRCTDDNLSDVSGDKKMIIERTTLAANALVKELGRTFYAFKSWEKKALSRIFLSGGPSVTTNFDKMLQDLLEVKTERCSLKDTSLKINAMLDPHMTIMPQSVAIGMRTVASIKKHSQINLRTGEFAYVQDYESIIRTGVRVGRIALVAVALLVFAYGFKFAVYKKHINKLQEQYRNEYIALFPDQRTKYGTNFDFRSLKNDADRKLEQKVNQTKDAVARFTAENSGSPALLLLRDISAGVPKEVKVDVTLYDFKAGEAGEGRITIQGETEGYAAQSAFIDALKKVNTLSDVTEKQSGTKPGTQDKIIQFTVQAKYVGRGGQDKKDKG